MSILKWFVPLLILFSYPSNAQVAGESPAPTVDSVCLKEILISTPQPSEPEEIAVAHRKADSAREAIRQGAKFEDIAQKYSDGPSAASAGIVFASARGPGNTASLLVFRPFGARVSSTSEPRLRRGLHSFAAARL